MGGKKTEQKPMDRDGRRAYRRRRRIRNQIIAYFTAFLILGIVIAGADFGTRQLISGYRGWQEGRNADPVTDPPESDPLPPPPVDDDPPPEVVDDGPDDVPPEDDPGDEDPPHIPSALDNFVADRIAELPLADKIAGLFFITPEELTATSPVVRAGTTTGARLEEHPVGGLIYFRQNIQSAGQLTTMLTNVREMSKYPIFLAIDEEGGRVARLAEARLATNIGPMADIGATGEREKAREAGQTIGGYLGGFGFDVNFAPVADVLAADGDSVIGDRSFGSDPATVAEMVMAFLGGAKETGILSAIKHFPGLGDTAADTHAGMAVSDRTLEEMRVRDFPPFAAAIAAGAEFVMVGHLSLPQVIGGNAPPASLSPLIVTELLREELGFAGVIITDALNMAAITEYYSPAEACVMAITAGADMLLMPENFHEAYAGLLAAVESGEISEERINESLRRIYRLKYRDRVED